MLEKLTAMQDRLLQRCLKSSQPFRISIPEMLEKLTAMLSLLEKLTAMQIGCTRATRKAHSHAGQDVPEVLEKLTSDVPEMGEKFIAMQDRRSQRCLESCQPCRIDCSRDG